MDFQPFLDLFIGKKKQKKVKVGLEVFMIQAFATQIDTKNDGLCHW